ncbi:diguanylate cyclase, partial [Streptomyces sp. NPDC059455]
MHGREECEAVVTDNGEIGGRPDGVDGRLRAVVRLAQEMAAAHTPQESMGGGGPGGR